ncbi:MAG: DUF4432 family protein [Paracoccaceae bacterium]
MMRVHLSDAMFARHEAELLVAGDIHVTTFRYASGVAALRVQTPRAELIVLPFKGQQVWRAVFDGVDVTMRSLFPEPVDTQDYLATYGAFLIHCGLTAIGGPGPEDTHPLHGELPNARFQEAYLEMRDGALVIGGTFRHAVAFTVAYLARTEITLAPDATQIGVTVEVENQRHEPMELMYLAHANFRPVDGGELIYAAPYTADAVRVRQSIPSHISPPPGYADFIAALAEDPERHHVFAPDLAFDPEVVFEVDMLPGADGWTHAMQRHPDGTADVISHVHVEGPRATRWICRTADQQGLGIVFPSTAGVEGYTAEKAKGRLVEVPGQGHWSIHMTMGRASVPEAEALAQKINQIAGR